MTGRERHQLSRLEWSIRALAQPRDVQETLFPQFVCLADELALDFEESLQGVEALQLPLAESVVEAVHRLDEQLEQMSGSENAALWTDEALSHSVEWDRVRELALVVVRMAGWSNSPPEPNSQVYVGPPN